MFQDLKFAIRVLSSKPAFTLAAAASLALGIGANSAIFGLFDAVALRPMAVPQSSRIVRLFSVNEQDREGSLSYPEYQDLRSQVSALNDVVALGGRGAFLDQGGERRMVDFNLVPANFFTALGVRPQLGAVFSEATRSGSAPPVVVVGNSAWHRYFGGDPNLVGKQIRILREKNASYTVVAVLPASFRDIDPGSDRDLWFPEDCWTQLGSAQELSNRADRWFQVLARLAPGESVESAKRQVALFGQRMAADYPLSNRGRKFALESDFTYRWKQAGENGMAALGVVWLVLLISAVNVANLLLSRANVRGKEMAVRLALGASRARLIGHLMVESLLLGACGLCLGILLGWWLLALVPSLIVQPPGFYLPNDFDFSSRVWVFTIGITLVTTVFFGLVPALRFTQPDLIPALQTDSAFSSPGRRRWPLRNWLVVAEIAVAMTLLTCSGLLVRSYSKTRTSDLGFARKQTLLVWIAADSHRPQTRDLQNRFAAMPGVKGVAVAVRAPLSLSSNGMFQRVKFPGRPEFAADPPFEIKYNAVSPEFLRQMGTPVVRGRDFDQRELSASSQSVVINEAMAQRFFAGLDPIGRVIEADKTPRTIVGVARNAPINHVGEAPEPYLYVPYWSSPEGEATYLINTEGDAAALAPAARQLLKQTDSTIDPLGFTTMAELIRYSASQYEVSAELLGALGLLGLILTAVGLYGVISYGIGQRSRELAIRMALGAGAGDTRLMVLGEVVILVLAGAAIGLPMALIATRFMKSMLFGVAPGDVPSIAGAAGLLLAVSLAAGFLPVRRATAVAPASLLRAL